MRLSRQNREELGISSTFLKAHSLKSDMFHWSRAKEAFKGGMRISHTLMSVKIMHLHFQSITSILDCYPLGRYTFQTLGLHHRRLSVFKDVRDTYEVQDATEIKSLLWFYEEPLFSFSLVLGLNYLGVSDPLLFFSLLIKIVNIFLAQPPRSCVRRCMHTYSCVKARVNLRCHSIFTFLCVCFETRFLTVTWGSQIWLGSAVNKIQASPVSTSMAGIANPCHYFWLGIELRCSCVCSQHFERASSPSFLSMSLTFQYNLATPLEMHGILLIFFLCVIWLCSDK